MVHETMNVVKRLPARFFASESGRMPVREWLHGLSEDERKRIGDDIRTAEFGWPVGMPLCRCIRGHRGLWEVRTNLPGNRTARVLFCNHEGEMILLHGFIKKSRKTPKSDLQLAIKRMRGLK